ncbi:carboxypeptidase regulatory-like domain-containing protein [Polymorphobacter sp. PAMC 29334]|uniref:carboxypeptidase regulatory-like domain-containing protein n=1 Tax=Polymorphobacter sp. PAMC 29334 TaxID=2862331 RepID=UPI001C74D089|nr:carboxypeptidase regulatory-like domain-containing protein [Polymorphobacter sp. PAMC 29334]QYE35481.1 carboxypeptidase regulatory-like domain-containing protein [Polymorphobacter sp. PAMC 29334]
MRKTPVGERDRPWRTAILLAAQAICAALLYLTLQPLTALPGGTLTVLTRHGGTILGGKNLVALPEAPAIAGAQRVPDLATALRRFAPARLKIIGDGLEPRDIAAAAGIPVDFSPQTATLGLVRVDFPAPVAPGASFEVGGQVRGITQPAVDLVDPAGSRVDTAVPDAAGNFVVSGTARAPGPARFTLRLRTGSRLVEETAVPESTVAVPAMRLLLLAGAPGPEVKYLRRWATEAGLAVHTQIATGGGLALGDAPLAITPATLARFDIAVLDERSWSGLTPGERSAMLAAVRAGLGLLVRIDGPLSAPDRNALQSLGFAVAAGEGSTPVALAAPTADEAARLARDGPGSSDAPARINRDAAVPALTRWGVRIGAAAASPLVRDAHGATIAAWRADGEGRIALWPLDDSFRLVLAGSDARYGELWRAAFATLGRGAGRATTRIEQPAWVGQRIALCGLTGTATVTAPDGGVATLVDEPAAGCAAYWPRVAGWHQLRQSGQSAPTSFAVVAAAALPNVRAEATRDATLRLASRQGSLSPAMSPGSIGPWPWAFAWLAVCAALWWFERSKIGVARRTVHAQP